MILTSFLYLAERVSEQRPVALLDGLMHLQVHNFDLKIASRRFHIKVQHFELSVVNTPYRTF